MRVPILYQDGDLVAVDKPAGIVLHPAVSEDPYPSSVLGIARAQLGLAYLGTPQRLDAEASGVVVCVTRRELLKELAAALAAPGAEQIFLALVHGSLPAASGKIDAPLTREGDAYRVTTSRDKHATAAITCYRVVDTGPGGRFSLIEAAVERGPGAEQVGCHLAHAGAPLVGDRAYANAGVEQPGAGRAGPIDITRRATGRGARPDREKERMGRSIPAGESLRRAAGEVGQRIGPGAGTNPRDRAPRQGLHAHRVTLAHPVIGQRMTFTAAPPALFGRAAAGLPELALAAASRSARRIRMGSPGLAELIELAVARRAALAAGAETTIYRLINAAADGLPGLAVDRFGDALVVNVYDEAPRPEPPAPALLSALGAAAGVSAVYVKYRQREVSRVDEEALPALSPGRPAIGTGLGEYVALEDGLRYLLRPGEGWNPGLFPDMREMRGRVRAWAAGKRVLNCFAYTCGFGVAAMAGGASRVANLDVSAPALERGRANYRLNGFAADERDFLYGDAFDWLERLAERRELFDMVILDPPGFARTKQHVWSAAQNYGKLAGLAAHVTAAGGLLIACCNVADLSWRSFEARIVAGLDQAWRAARVVGRFGAPGIDFPVEPGREGYLKILVARLA